MKLLRLFTDSDLVSRFEEVEVGFAPADFAPPAPPVDVSPPTPASALLLARFPTGWADAEHPAPARQWMYVLSGEVVVTAGGETRRFVTGDALLVEDTDGPGHASEVVAEALIAVVRV